VSRYRVTLSGCDDATYLDDVALTDEQYAAVARIADMSTAASEYGCMPTLSVQPQPEAAS
jgi:hypothetical protein